MVARISELTSDADVTESGTGGSSLDSDQDNKCEESEKEQVEPSADVKTGSSNVGGKRKLQCSLHYFCSVWLIFSCILADLYTGDQDMGLLCSKLCSSLVEFVKYFAASDDTITRSVSRGVEVRPFPDDECHATSTKQQKVYKSYRTRRNLADCAIVVEELWWK